MFPEPTVWWLVVLRLLSYTTTVLLVGVVVSHMLGSRIPRWRALAAAAAAGLLATRAALLAGQTWLLFAPEDPPSLRLATTVATATSWGHGWLLQAAACLLVLAGLAVHRSRPATGSRAIATGTLASALLIPLTGHANEYGWLSLPMLQQAAHGLAAATWIGSLAYLWRASRTADPARLRTTVERFSPVALACGAIILASGALTGWGFIGSLSALLESDYGRLLLVKMALASGVFAAGAYNWRRVRPTLHTPEGRARLRRVAGIELTLALLVLLATAALVGHPQPGG